MRKVRAAVVGSGLIAGKKHIPAFQRLRHKTELVAICDLNLAAAKEVAARFGIPRTYSNIAEMLHSEKPDLVDICTPPQTHTRLAVEAMRHGSHVLIEKPMALTSHDFTVRTLGTQVAGWSDRGNGPTYCVHDTSLYPPYSRRQC